MQAWARTFAAAAAALFILAFPAASRAMPQAIWENSENSVITRGVTLEKIKRFTADGWLAIDVIRVDLADPYVSLDSLYNGIALQDLTTVKELAERQGAVAAINGGYFEWNDDWGGTPIGTVMQNGRIDSAFSETNAFGSVMASFTINKAKETLFAYCKPTITLKAAGKAELDVNSYNKRSFYDYRDVTIHDRKWIKDSVGASKSRLDIVELVAERGLVREIRVGLPAVEIPTDGFVAITRLREDGTHAFSGAEFAPGSAVEFIVTIKPTLKDAVAHVEGASMLLRDGAIPEEFTYEPGYIALRNPRTMIGGSRDGRELLLVTVDGRQLSSIGLTSYESAELMRSLGAFNALSLDGGGSTTMVARAPGAYGLELINSVSDGSMRPVVNGFGVFTGAPKAAVRGLVIDAIDTNVFVGAHRQFTARAYDRFYNPIDVDPNDIVWSLSGFEGKIENGLLVPETAGTGQVRAKVGRARASVQIKVLSAPSELILNATSLALKPGETHTFAVIGRDRAGFSARINPADVTWSASDSFGSIENGVFRRGGDKSGYIAAAYGNAAAYCAVQPVPKAGEQPPKQAVKLPPATKIADAANRAADFSAASDGGGANGANGALNRAYRFGVLGEPQPAAQGEGGVPPSDAGGAAPAWEAFVNTVNGSLDCAVFVGYGGGRGGAGVINKPAYVTNSFFETHDAFCGDPSASLIRLSSIGNGLRAAGKGQWGMFLGALDAFSGRNLFIILQQGPSTFGDKYEAALLKQILAERARDKGYDIWVFYGGPADTVWLEDGVRYFTCAGAASPAADKTTGAGAKYLEVAVQNGEVTYQFMPLIEK